MLPIHSNPIHARTRFGDPTKACKRYLVGRLALTGSSMARRLHSTTRICNCPDMRAVHVFELLAQSGSHFLAQNG
jgi:hypothetical protein